MPPQPFVFRISGQPVCLLLVGFRYGSFTQLSKRSKPSFSAVMPTTMRDIKFLRLQSKSCRNVLTPDIVSDLHLVVPDEEFQMFITATSNFSLPIWRIHKESDFLPEIKNLGRGHSGWELQQEIKLAAYRWMENDFYFTLDADVICTGYDLKQVMHTKYNQRANACLEYIGPGSRFFGKKNFNTTLIALDISINHYPDFAMGWTPQLLSKLLLQDIEHQFEKNNQTFLEHLMMRGRQRKNCIQCNNTWTEYFAYFALAYELNLWDKYHQNIASPGIEIGECFSREKRDIPARPGCLKLRAVCPEDAELLLNDPNLAMVPFGVLNDHQMTKDDYSKFLSLLETRRYNL